MTIEPSKQPSIPTLAELQQQGVPAGILADLIELAKIRAARATRKEGVIIDEFVEDRYTGEIGQVTAVHDEHVTVDFGDRRQDLNYGLFFSPISFAAIAAELCQEYLRVKGYAEEVADDLRLNAAKIIAPQRHLDAAEWDTSAKLPTEERNDAPNTDT